MTHRSRRAIVTAGRCWLVLIAVTGSVAAQESEAGDAVPSAQGGEGGEEFELDEGAAFARARSFYEASDYKRCEDAFSALLRPDAANRLRSRNLIEQARVYYAACLLGLGQPRDAEEQLKAAIANNPLMPAPDPLVFPALFVDRFFAVRSRMMEEIRRAEERRVERLRREAEAAQRQDAAVLARLAELERMALRESVVQRNSRWIAAIPFGVGQFQNREPGWGWFFLTSELVLAGAATAAVSVQLSLHSQAGGGTTSKDTEEINNRLDLAHRIEMISLAGLLGMSTIGIVQAQLAFVPEIRLPDRQRRDGTPSAKLRITPSAAPTAGGAVFGISGRF